MHSNSVENGDVVTANVAYIGASNVGPKSSTEDNVRIGANVRFERNAYIDVPNAGPSSSKDKSCSNARLDAYTVDRPRDQKDKESETHSSSSATSHTEPSPASEEDDTRYVAYSACSGAQLRNRKSSVMKDDISWRSSVMKDDVYRRSSVMQDDARKKEDGGLETEEKTKGTMQVETDTGQTAYIQVEPDTGQTACTLRRQKTGSVMQVETDTGQTVYTQVEPETGQTAYIQVEPDTGQTAYTLPTVPMPSSEEDGRTDRAVARQTEEECPLLSDRLELSPIKTSLSMLEDAVDKLLLVPQYHDYRVKPEMEIEPLEKPDSMSYVPQSCKGEPLTKPDMEIYNEACPSDYIKNLVSEAAHDDVPTRRYRKGKAEANAKAGATRHLPRDPDSTTKTSATGVNAGKHQPSSSDDDKLNYRNDLNQMLNCRKIRLNNDWAQDKLPEIKAPKQKSICTRRKNRQKQEDKKERRRAKRQGRHTSGETTPAQPPAEDISSFANQAVEMPRHMTKRAILEAIEHLRKNFARLTHNKDKSDPLVRQVIEEFSESNRRYLEWEDRFLFRIGATVYHSAEVSFIGEETAYRCGWHVREFQGGRP